MKLSEYVVLGRPMYTDRDFHSEGERNRIITCALERGMKMQAQGFYLLDFCFRDEKLVVRVGEEPYTQQMAEEA